MPKKRLFGKKSHPDSQGRRRSTRKPSVRTEAARARGLSAINLVRKGAAKTLAAAARAEHTTVRTIQRWLPKALVVDRSRRVRGVKPRDPYSQRVKIVGDDGVIVVTARDSRERELAGRHRATSNRILGNQEPPSSLAAFKGKRVGGHKLVSDYERLRTFAEGGELDQLDALYVLPEVRS